MRAAIKKGFLEWLIASQADIVCLQEIKAFQHQLPVQEIESLGYSCHWYSSQKKGYSGLAVLSKLPVNKVQLGMNHELYDYEGRVMLVQFKDFHVLNVYMPSGGRPERQLIKLQFLKDFYAFLKKELAHVKHLIITGDFNICHQWIDIHNPIRNQNNPGFTPEERRWMDNFLESGFTDAFRHFNQEPDQYTWWSYRSGARRKNLGWRIDYILVSDSLKDQLQSSKLLKRAEHSDHCPVLVELVV